MSKDALRQSNEPIKARSKYIKAVLHGTTCNVNFSRNNVARIIEHRVTWCRGRFFAQHLIRQRVASFWFGFKNSKRFSIFFPTVLRGKSTLQVVPCNTALKATKSSGKRAPVTRVWLWSYYKANLSKTKANADYFRHLSENHSKYKLLLILNCKML